MSGVASAESSSLSALGSGVGRRYRSTPDTTGDFGFAHERLASEGVADALLLAHKPAALSFEAACTLPSMWSTAHAALERGVPCSRSTILVQAAAGGVGFKVVEYLLWLGASSLSLAGKPSKNAQLRAVGVRGLGGLRSCAVFVAGMLRLLGGVRLHAALGCLSQDFIAVSLASLSEYGAVQQLDKRSTWSCQRCTAAAPSRAYAAITLDGDIGYGWGWLHGALELLVVRVKAGTLTSLPLLSFDMWAQHTLAFRTLQRGRHIGRVVLRVTGHDVLQTRASGVHVVTGGTGGLGFLTGRWLTQNGARPTRSCIASRCGGQCLGNMGRHGADGGRAAQSAVVRLG